MKESRKELILELHSEVFPSFKLKIEKEFPKLFKKDNLVVGKWYKEEITNFLIFIKDLKRSSYAGYGFNTRGDWKDFLGRVGLQHIPATDEEVKQALIKEAKKRGFKIGSKVECLLNNETVTVEEMEFVFTEDLTNFWVKQKEIGFWCLLVKDGVWATIIEETITKEQAEKELGKIIID